MNTFLRKISQLESIQDVILLSARGEPLFSALPIVSNVSLNRMSQWLDIIKKLGYPDTADLVFEIGRYFLRKTDLGYLIIGMTDGKDLAKIKAACDNTLHKLSDAGLRKKVLLRMLTDSDDAIKLNLIKELVPVADGEVAAALVALLERDAGFKPQVREKLQLFICQTLGHCNSYEALEPLKSFLARHKKAGDGGKLAVEIREAVRLSIRQLESSAPKQTTRPLTLTDPMPPAAAQKAPAPASAGVPQQAASSTIPVITATPDVPRAADIAKLVSDGKNDEALSLLLQLIEENATAKQFRIADRLRTWLMQLYPMALMQIVRAAEIIEEEKMASINPDHLKIWKGLVDLLTPEEFSALYYAMELKHFGNGEMIASQGGAESMLVLINSGRVQIQAVNKGLVVPLKFKEAGDIIGADTLFEASVWTVNVKSLGTELFLLKRGDLDGLQEEHPSLESKLSHFCSGFQSTSSLLKEVRKNRREHERKRLAGRLSFALLDQDGEETGIVAKGDLLDISKGGVAFAIHSSQKKNAVSLFGRNIRVSINAGLATGLLTRNGVVRAVRDMDLIGNEYSLHIQFDQLLTATELQQALSAGEK